MMRKSCVKTKIEITRHFLDKGKILSEVIEELAIKIAMKENDFTDSST